jgi:NAD(P)-dependent dehydrogenase (short-subunit alcohol dehydrogenase family)
MSVVLVTGASSGIGRACAEHLARAGHTVYGTSRGAEPISALSPSAAAAPAPGAHAGPRLVRMELTDDESVRGVIDGIQHREGRLDAVVNNAGYGLAGAVEDTSIGEAQAQMDANFLGAVRVCRAVLPQMRQRGGGCIVNVTSMAGLVGIPFQSFYTASKFALEGFSSALRAEVHPYGIRVVVIRPGDFQTGFTSGRRRVGAWDASAYRARCEQALAIMEREEQQGPTPDGIAALVTRVVEGKDAGTSFVVGNVGQRALIALRRLLPERGVDGLLRRYYRL